MINIAGEQIIYWEYRISYKMKKMKKIFLLIVISTLFSVIAKSQILGVAVEKFYISDTLDATDSTNYHDDATYAMPVLPAGSITYRVYVKLAHGYKIKKIYGTPCNPLKIVSTANFFNNIDRPASFGYQVGRNWFSGTPTIALDSWLTLGLCAKFGGTTKYAGVLKTQDPNGSLLGNGGGTAAIPGGILVNADTAAGIPLDTAASIKADGMVVTPNYYGSWIPTGFADGTGTDTTVFGNSNVGSTFVSIHGYLKQSAGVSGDSTLGINNVLVAQLTTTGTITFELNLELIDSIGNSINVVSHECGVPVSGDTIVSGLLKFPPDPPACGCLDPNFLEYNASLLCSAPDSCHTKIIFGCMDTLACNYAPTANYHIQSLCCYPGKCNDRDISLVCPSISGDGGFQLFPNPASEQITLQFSSGNNNETKYVIYDSYGVVSFQKDLGVRTGSITEPVDISGLQTGLYFVKMYIGTITENKTFMKQ
jgi:hypothetical protein